MLVDVLSQYGVGSIVFLAGVFALVPIGNGTLALTEGALAAGMFCCAYLTLRLARVGLALAWSTHGGRPRRAGLQPGLSRRRPAPARSVPLRPADGDPRRRCRRGPGRTTGRVSCGASRSRRSQLRRSGRSRPCSTRSGALAGVAVFRIATASAARREMAVRILASGPRCLCGRCTSSSRSRRSPPPGSCRIGAAT